MIFLFLNFVLFVLVFYLSLYVAYNVFLLIVNIIVKPNDKIDYEKEAMFLVVIPAHNEELFIKRILDSFARQNYSSDLFKLIVVADNCTDDTANCVSGDNVEILVRKSAKDFGKGYAIKYALDNMSDFNYDALFIIDADSVLARDGLLTLNQHIFRGTKILQCNNALANPEDSWFTLLMDVARTLENDIMEPAKEKLGLSSHLMGNGMCFHREIIDKYGWNAFSIGEDWEYYAKIINKGERIAFAQDVRVYHQESTSLKQATPQRMRWSSGRFAVLKQYGIGLFWQGLIEKNLLKFDASLPLIFPNPSLAINLTALGLIFSFLFFIIYKNIFWVNWFAILILCQVLIFTSAVFYTRNKLKSFMSIFIAPIFLIWKMSIDILSFLGKGRGKWVRTKRHL